jgi:hypothetical protein
MGEQTMLWAKATTLMPPFKPYRRKALTRRRFIMILGGSLSGSWGIYVKDSRDGTTICSVDPAPEDGSETTNNTSVT